MRSRVCILSGAHMKDLREMLPYMDADVTAFSDYSVNHQMAPAFAVCSILIGCFVPASV